MNAKNYKVTIRNTDPMKRKPVYGERAIKLDFDNKELRFTITLGHEQAGSIADALKAMVLKNEPGQKLKGFWASDVNSRAL